MHADTAFQAFRQFQRGFMPWTGGWVDQPCTWVDAMNIMDAVHTEVQTSQRAAEVSATQAGSEIDDRQ